MDNLNMFSAVTDIQMTNDGDLIVSDGDLATITGVDWFMQEVNKILRTSNPDWQMHPNVGADLEEFAGKPNVREVGRAIEKQIYDKVTADNIQFPGKLNVRAVPMSKDSILVYLTLEVQGQVISVSKNIFDFDTGVLKDAEVNTPDVPSQTIDMPRNTVQATNPYLNRIK